ncbi:cadherin repeat domain-containing protein [Aquimarina sp. 2201CG14-23]|uniref:cadherin repeat domain-containing protein n=1 Tax=Aquimarina mycalae TaxID=3040073 RepID=UPI002478233B|nr:cadherin repeat domain-containing protein [Aquimarina sp. 2201CG14-23]MDH7447305.1 cadherin repeat domain-containing protein [Aquimarina sp. 2201CG14-23]
MARGFFWIMGFILILSCSSNDNSLPIDSEIEEEIIIPEEEETFIPTLEVSDLQATLDEHPESGYSIGTISITANFEGPFTFSILNQSVDNALEIDSITGEILVKDSSVFNYEINTGISATINVRGGELSKTSNINITVNDIDDIEYLLSDSKLEYNQAANGDWIRITEEEYNGLASEILQVSKSGIDDSEYLDVSEIISSTSTPTTLANQTEIAVMPIDSYIFAFKYYVVEAIGSKGSKIKQSSISNSEEFIDVGNPLPEHSAINEEVYFVLKGNTVQTLNTAYLAFFKTAGLTIGRKDSSDDNTYYFALSDTNSFVELSDTRLKILYQGLSTNVKQW